MCEVTLTNLPAELLEEIFSYVTFEQMSKLRETCQLLNQVCSRLLNEGFFRAERCVQNSLKMLRAQLPRRESERRSHPLFRRVELFSAVETRLGLLNMTYRRFITSQLCCFIPGKAIDEVFKVLQFLRVTDDVRHLSPNFLLQELRDISSMAMEHFDEHISPRLREVELEVMLGRGSQQSGESSPFSTTLAHRFPALKSPEGSPQQSLLTSLLSRSAPPCRSFSDHLRGPSRLISLLTAAASVAADSPLSRSLQSRALSVPNTVSPSTVSTATAVTGKSQHCEAAGDSNSHQQLQQQVISLSDRLTAQDALISQLTARVSQLEKHTPGHQVVTEQAGVRRSRRSSCLPANSPPLGKRRREA